MEEEENTFIRKIISRQTLEHKYKIKRQYLYISFAKKSWPVSKSPGSPETRRTHATQRVLCMYICPPSGAF